MSKYTEMREFLATIGKTHEEMQEMWDYCVKNGHALIRQLARCGKNWSDMNTAALTTLETTYLRLKQKRRLNRDDSDKGAS